MLKHTLDDVSSSGKLKGGSRSTLCKLVLCLCIVLLASCAKRYDDDPGWVARELVYAFVDADVDRAKAVTVPEQWDRIEKWMEGREPFKCREGSWETGASGVGLCGSANSECNYMTSYKCLSEHTPYYLGVKDIQVRETEDGLNGRFTIGEGCARNSIILERDVDNANGAKIADSETHAASLRSLGGLG